MVNLKKILKKKYKKVKRSTMWNKPQLKGICLKVFTVSPKKPNSAKRKVAKVMLSNKKVVTAYIVGESNNLEMHNIVLIRGGKVNDCVGIKHKIIRGKYDMKGVKNRQSSKSKYGAKKVKK